MTNGKDPFWVAFGEGDGTGLPPLRIHPGAIDDYNDDKDIDESSQDVFKSRGFGEIDIVEPVSASRHVGGLS